MFFIVLRKILNNKWMVACLLVGSIVAVAMISSIPMYTDGILQRMLIKDMEAYQQRTGSYPGRYLFKLNCFTYYKPDSRYGAFLYFRQNIRDKLPGELDTPIAEHVEKLTIDYIALLPEVQKAEKPSKAFIKLVAYTDYLDHITITSGRLPSTEMKDGVLEVLINESVQKEKDLMLDEIYLAEDISKLLGEGIVFKVRPVGLFSYKEANDAWWFEYSFRMGDVALLDYGLFERYFLEERQAVSAAEWYYAVDYTKLTIDHLPTLLDVLHAREKWYAEYPGTRVAMGVKPILEEYFIREKQLRITLWVLQAPIIMMLAFYIFMVSQLIVENDRNEIAVLKSRGAGRLQLFGSYLLHSALLSAVAVAAGPFVAMGICRVLGASNGFLELVSRTALPITMRIRSIQYAMLAGVFSVLTMIMPAMSATRFSIVELKQKKARRWNAPFWQKIFLDLILIGVSLYGYNSFANRQATLVLTSAEALDVPIDPMLFMISTLFVLGVGLLFLRVYPFIIRFIYWLGHKIWSPVLYATFIQVGRSGGREQFLMLFIILTMSIGVFSANSARTINQNIEDRVYYEVGADIALQTEWENNAPPEDIYSMDDPSAAAIFGSDPVIIYREPDYDIISSIEGIEATAKVLMPAEPRFRLSRNYTKRGVLMAIEPSEFGRVVWSSSDLLPHHINEYLNLMTYAPNAVLVSSAFRDQEGMQVGDSFEFYWEGQTRIEAAIAAFVDYWPGINPHLEESRYFVIANLNYTQAKTMLEPYQVWMKKEEGALSRTVYDDMAAKGIKLYWIRDASQEMVARKNDALLQGTNGALTLGFVVTMLISLLGFIIYWILSIQSRKLQFGIFRAMGMTQGQVVGMLICEQILISLAAVLTGILIGGVTSDLFVPLLQMVYSAEQQVPPFRIVSSRADYYRIYAIVGFMLVSGFAILGALISRIRVAQAIKLGED